MFHYCAVYIQTYYIIHDVPIYIMYNIDIPTFGILPREYLFVASKYGTQHQLQSCIIDIDL